MSKDTEYLKSLMKKYKSDKADHGKSYHLFYDKELQDIRFKINRVLEIGLSLFKNYKTKSNDITHNVDTSLKIWLDYFPNCSCVGLDKNDYSFIDNPRIKVHRLDQSNLEHLKKFRENEIKSEPFDLIIDDGSHISHHQQLTLEFLFPLLRPGGFYFIEDLNLTFSHDNILTSIRTVDLLKKWQKGEWTNPSMFMNPINFKYLKDNIAEIRFNTDKGLERNRLALIRKKIK
jgi:hypothetical protein